MTNRIYMYHMKLSRSQVGKYIDICIEAYNYVQLMIINENAHQLYTNALPMGTNIKAMIHQPTHLNC